MKKTIKLVNNERINAKIASIKACDATSYDVCTVLNEDNAECKQYSYDRCGKDYALCYSNGYDLCYNIDNTACTGSTEDITY